MSSDNDPTESQTASLETDVHPARQDPNGEPASTPAGAAQPAICAEACPECGGIFIPEPGCWVCRNCGYGRCG